MKKLNVLLMPMARGSLGDVNPFIGLGLALRERGHQVTLLASGCFEPQISKAGLDFVEAGTAECFKVSDYAKVRAAFEGQRRSNQPARGWHYRGREFLHACLVTRTPPNLWDPVGIVRFIVVRLHTPVIRSQYQAIVERHILGRTVVVASSLAFGARIARDALGIPLVTGHLEPSAFRSIYEPHASLKILSWLPAFAMKAVYKCWDKMIVDPLCAPMINFFRSELGLEPIEQMFVWWHSPDRVLAFFPPFFAKPQPDWPPQTRLVGFPFFDADRTEPVPEELSEFIKGSEVTVVFTTGWSVLHARQFYHESVRVCEALGCRGILLTPYPEQIPDMLPETVRHFQYVPFSQLFPLVDAVVHHGGIGTIAQCLRAGVRQLIVPFLPGQVDNAWRAERLGVGLSLKPSDYHGEKLIQKMNELLKSECLKRAALRWKQTLQEQEKDALTIACQEIEALVQ